MSSRKKIKLSDISYIEITKRKISSKSTYHQVEVIELGRVILEASAKTEKQAIQDLIELSEWQTKQLRKALENT